MSSGTGGKIVFHQAYGSRKVAGEPGLDGSPAPAEPMTEDTIFDVASLTKPLATAPAVMQLYEEGKVRVRRSRAELSARLQYGERPTACEGDRSHVAHAHVRRNGRRQSRRIRGDWRAADKTEGIHRALTTPLEFSARRAFSATPISTSFLLGALMEKVTGEAEDVYVQEHVFAPLGMDETAVPSPGRRMRSAHDARSRDRLGAWSLLRRSSCPPAGTWNTSLLPRMASPTARRRGGQSRSGQESRHRLPASGHRA